MSDSADILALLDQVAEKQIRCPECDRADDLYYVPFHMESYVAAATFDGKVVVAGDSEWYDPPSEFLDQFGKWMLCNHLDHATKKVCLFRLPDDFQLTWDLSYDEVMAMRGGV